MSAAERTVVLNLLAAIEGGQVTRAFHFLAALRRHDPHGSYLILKARGTLPFCRPERGIDVQEVEIGHTGALRAARRMLWENRELPRLVQPSNRRMYLTFSHYLPATFPRACASVVGVSNLAPFSAEAAAAEPRRLGRLKLKALRATVLSSVRRANAVIALSHACKDALVGHGIDAQKIHVVSNGVELDGCRLPERGVARSLGLKPGYLLCVSHFHRYKNYARLVQAYGSLDAQRRAALPLVLVGKPLDAGCFAEIEARVRAARLTDSVRIVPGLDHAEVLDLYRGANAFVFPSLIENSPNILLEAMASGLPVMAGRIAPMPEFGGEAAQYFDPLDPADIARTIEKVAADPVLRATMRERSLARAARYTWDDFTARVVSICRAAGSTGGLP